MLAGTQRLRRSNEFAATVRAGRRVGRGALVVHLTQAGASPVDSVDNPATGTDEVLSMPARAGAEQRLPPARAGFVVSKAVGNAVTRNKVRRRLRHLVRERLAGLPPGATLVVRALPAAAQLPYARLAADLDAAMAAARASRKPARRLK